MIEQIDPLVGSTIDGKYHVLSLLRVGGMGSVYKAEQESIGRFVAIKILNDLLLDETHLKRLHNEANALKRLTHPNVVRVIAFSMLDSGRPCLVLEYVEGESLAEKLKRDGPMSADSSWQIFSQIAEAMKHAHEQGLIHRDLKPANIMLCAVDGGTKVKVVDFGVSRLMDLEGQRFTRAGAIIGSPAYMSPEQCAGQQPTFQSDIYSFGCLMYETLLVILHSTELTFTTCFLSTFMMKRLSRFRFPECRCRPQCEQSSESVCARNAQKDLLRWMNSCAHSKRLAMHRMWCPLSLRRIRLLRDQR